MHFTVNNKLLKSNVLLPFDGRKQTEMFHSVFVFVRVLIARKDASTDHVCVNLSSLPRSSSTKERGDQEQDPGHRQDGQSLFRPQVT